MKEKVDIGEVFGRLRRGEVGVVVSDGWDGECGIEIEGVEYEEIDEVGVRGKILEKMISGDGVVLLKSDVYGSIDFGYFSIGKKMYWIDICNDEMVFEIKKWDGERSKIR